jgi:predicted nucleic acid-binding protein
MSEGFIADSSVVYDATYLELAVRRKLPLASRDQALCKAAQGCRIKLLL